MLTYTPFTDIMKSRVILWLKWYRLYLEARLLGRPFIFYMSSNMRPQNMNNYNSFQEFHISPKFIVRNEWNVLEGQFYIFGRRDEWKVDPDSASECIFNSKYSEHISCICM